MTNQDKLNELKNMVRSLSPADLDWVEEHWADNRAQVFTFTDLKTKATIHVNVSKFIADIDAHKVPCIQTMMALPGDLYLQLLNQQGIERSHLDKLNLDNAVYHPAIIIEDENGDEISHLIVDGNHKLVKSYELGLRRHPAIMVKRKYLDPYLFDMPPSISEIMQRLAVLNLQLGDVVAELVAEKLATTS